MATIKSNSKFLTISLRNEVVVLNFESHTVHNLQCNTKTDCNNKNKEDNNNIGIFDDTVFLPCSDLSNCGNWFIFCHMKCLLLYSTRDWSLVSCGHLQRSPSKVKFSSDGSKILVADKGGDVYIFSRENLSLPGTLLLGHLSVLFDVIFSEDEKFIISCDRDEKIRVSCYPNAYNINSYCLGHEEFVTSLNLIPHCHSILISTSGDRTLRFWDFSLGKEILMYNCSRDIDEMSIEYDDAVPFIDNIAVIKSEIFQLSEDESVACILFNNYRNCLVYSVKGSNNNLQCKKVQNITLSNVLCDIFIYNKLLWVLTSKDTFSLSVLQWIDTNKRFEAVNENMNNSVKVLNNHLDNFECKFKSKIGFIYKKQYNTVQEYNKRKNDKLHKIKKIKR